MEPSQTLIAKVIERYHPDWLPPEPTGRDWVPCLCPWHGDTRPSAAVSYKHNAFRCMACPARGSAVSLIMRNEEVDYQSATAIAEGLAPGGISEVLRRDARVPRRGVPRFSRATAEQPSNKREVPSGVRGGPRARARNV
ncbi:DNA primase [Mycobacterium phage Bones]|nr:DNA primase [Mycobacterium phage Bones]